MACNYLMNTWTKKSFWGALYRCALFARWLFPFIKCRSCHFLLITRGKFFDWIERNCRESSGLVGLNISHHELCFMEEHRLKPAATIETKLQNIRR